MSRAPDNDKAFWADTNRFLLPEAELRQRFGPLVTSVREALGERFVDKSRQPETLELGDTRFAFSPAMILMLAASGPRLATRSTTHRGVKKAVKEQGERFRAYAAGEGCRGNLEVGGGAHGKVSFTLSLEDEQGHRLRPFFVTVRDRSGTMLRNRVRFAGWEGTITDVPMGEYTFLLEDESGKRRVELGVEPR